MTEFTDVIAAFRQSLGENRNGSLPVAVIKAAIDVFGVHNVFVYSQTSDRYYVTLRNGVELMFNQSDLEYCSYRADFTPVRGRDESQNALLMDIYDYARLCYCVMVKHVLVLGEGNQTRSDWNDAMDVLNSSLDAEALPMLLGITNVKGPQPWMSSQKESGIIAWNEHRAVFASHGYYDHFGEMRQLGPLFPKRIQLIG